MQKLEIHEIRHLQAAEGWLGLGLIAEAHLELKNIPATKHSHPMFLQVSYQICAREKNWKVCVTLAESMVKVEPSLPFGWIHRSYALHELKRTREALEQLQPAVRRFPKEATVRYNLACYECVLGNLPKARQRLAETFKIAAAEETLKEYRRTAAEDPDLKALWGSLPS